MAIQAIETTYKGFKLRSFLERKWCVFFDRLGVAWYHEYMPIDLSSGDWYIPDFYLPQVDMFAEVKPTPLTPKEERKVKALAKDTNKPILMLVGAPDFTNYDAWQMDPWGGGLMKYDYSLVPFFLKDGRFPCLNFCPSGDEDAYGNTYFLAVYASRAERFEFGGD